MITARGTCLPAFRIGFSRSVNSFDELNAAAGPLYTVFYAIQLEVFDHQHGLRRQVALPQQRPNARG
jgi:hypothetical protein